MTEINKNSQHMQMWTIQSKTSLPNKEDNQTKTVSAELVHFPRFHFELPLFSLPEGPNRCFSHCWSSWLIRDSHSLRLQMIEFLCHAGLSNLQCTSNQIGCVSATGCNDKLQMLLPIMTLSFSNDQLASSTCCWPGD